MNRFNALPPQFRAVFWMLLQVASMVAMMASVRQLSTAITPHEAAFFRGFIGLLVLLPWAVRTGPRLFRPPAWRMIGLRSLFAAAGTLCWFLALGGMAISDVVALQFTHPLFVILGAGLILREAVSGRRWAVAAAGFVGALVIIRPGLAEVNPLAFFVLLSAMFNAGVQLITKHVSPHTAGAMLAFYMNLFLAPAALLFALPGWVTPGLAELPWVLAVGFFGTIAHIFLTRAFEAADASFVSPVDFMRLPMAAVAGWILFRETSDVWTWAGAAVIFAAVTWNTRHETRTAS